PHDHWARRDSVLFIAPKIQVPSILQSLLYYLLPNFDSLISTLTSFPPNLIFLCILIQFFIVFVFTLYNNIIHLLLTKILYIIEITLSQASFELKKVFNNKNFGFYTFYYNFNIFYNAPPVKQCIHTIIVVFLL
ncbi:hypothetical protein SLOPH_999, partial [Spraguea lophii 42_110]